MDDLDARFESLKTALAERTPPGLPDAGHLRARRVRRRALDLGVFLVALLMVAGVLAVLSPNSANRPEKPGNHRTTPVPTETGLTFATLPARFWFDQISAVDGRVLLSGEDPAVVGESPTCVVATLDPQTLRLTATTHPSCDDPAIVGEEVMAVNTYVRETNNATISIARVDSDTGHVSVGPVVMTYGSYSDTRPVMAYGGGWLWIYDVETTVGAELLQVSASSGRVEDTVAMPKLYRPILAANDYGLWIGNSIQGSPSPDALYHVSPGSHSASGVIAGSELNVFWLLGSGQDLWAGIGPTFVHQSIWRFDKAESKPAFRVPDHGYDPTTVVGDDADGLWTVVPYPPLASKVPSGKYPEDVVRIDPNTGKETVVATLPRNVLPDDEAGLNAGQGVYVEGSLFALEPPFRADGYLGYSRLLRVRAQG
jgi:hypothetical protein